MDEDLRALEREVEGGVTAARLRLVHALDRAGQPGQALALLRDGARAAPKDQALRRALQERLTARSVAEREWTWRVEEAGEAFGVRASPGRLEWWSLPDGPMGRFESSGREQSWADFLVDGPPWQGTPADILAALRALLEAADEGSAGA